MGILNLTEDSFYDGGKNNTLKEALSHTEKMLEEGAFFIDIGRSEERRVGKECRSRWSPYH